MTKKEPEKIKKRLHKKFYEAYKILEDTSYKQRIKPLENIEEYGFALLIKWNRIEMLLKLLRYVYTWESYPDKLDFIRRNWGPLNHIYNLDDKCYKYIIDKENKVSLWNLRNKIAHASYNISKHEYETYKSYADKFYNLLEQNKQTKEEYTTIYNRKRKFLA